MLTAQERGNLNYLPYVIVYGLHHSALSLPDSYLEAFGLTIASQGCRSMAYSTIRVHPDHRFSRSVLCGIHGLAGKRGEDDTVHRAVKQE